MKNDGWDYSTQARYYEKRPNYSDEGIDYMLNFVGANKEDYIVADIGAGTGNLTKLLAEKVGKIIAVEPNDFMKEIGIKATEKYGNLSWINGTGEDTKLPTHSVNLVTFGSSFNTTDRLLALRESYRILKPDGFFVCMWNNRDLTIPSQKRVEEIIKKYFPDYSHGTRREQQADFILNSGLFNHVSFFEFPKMVEVSLDDYCEAWKSVKNKFWDLETSEGKEILEKIIQDIKKEFREGGLNLKYITRIWIAKKKEEK